MVFPSGDTHKWTNSCNPEMGRDMGGCLRTAEPGGDEQHMDRQDATRR